MEGKGKGGEREKGKKSEVLSCGWVVIALQLTNLLTYTSYFALSYRLTGRKRGHCPSQKCKLNYKNSLGFLGALKSHRV